MIDKTWGMWSYYVYFLGCFAVMPPKGQKISKFLFGVFSFLQKTNETKSTWGIMVVKSNSFVRFLEETLSWKKLFRICLTFSDNENLIDSHVFLVSNFVAVFRQQKPGIIKYFYLPHFWSKKREIQKFLQESFLRL